MPYRPSNPGAIARLIMEGGDAQARGVYESGQIWGNQIANIGQTAAGSLSGFLTQRVDQQAYDAEAPQRERKAERERLENEKLRGEVGDASQVRNAADLSEEQDAQIQQLMERFTEGGVVNFDAMAQELLQLKVPAEKVQESLAPLREIQATARDNQREGFKTLLRYSQDVKTLPELYQVGRMAVRLKAIPAEMFSVWMKAAGNDPQGVRGFIQRNLRGLEMVPEQARNPTEASLAYEATGEGPEAARAEEAFGMLNPLATPAAPAPQDVIKSQRREQLIGAVMKNPALWNDLTPSVKSEIAGDLSAKNFAGFGKALSDVAIKQITDTRAAISSVRDLRIVLGENEQYVGPLAGLQTLNPWSEGRKAQADIDRVRQRVGRALEGGVLRKEDEEKYKRILATLFDTPETAVYKIDQMLGELERDLGDYIDTQSLSGRHVDPSLSTVGEAPGNANPFRR